MASRSRSISLATILESSPLSTNRATAPFANNFSDISSIFSNVLQRHLGTVGAKHQLVRVPGQPAAPIRLLGVSIDRGGGDVLFEPIQLGYEILDLLLDVFRMLGTSMSVARDSHPLGQYLIMLDKRVHAAQSRFEGWEPIGGLLRNIEKNLRAIRDPVSFRCEWFRNQTCQRCNTNSHRLGSG